MVNAVHTSLDVTICADADDAKAQGFDYAAVGGFKPIEVEKVVVVRNGTQGGNASVDFVLKDDSGQRFVFMVTGRLLKSIPC